jgi:hypothetical protein
MLYTWTSVPKTNFAENTLQHAGTSSFTIPTVIPSSAREVLIYTSMFSAWSSVGPHQDVKIFTQIGTTPYEKYLHVYSAAQNAINTNSDNMWFPMPPNRRVYITVPRAHGSGTSVYLSAIGYR